MTAPTSKGPRRDDAQRPTSSRRLKAAPAPALSPLEALLAGLGALLEAHKASATAGAALVLWRVLTSLHALASRALAAPSALALEALEETALAGLRLREKGEPAAAPQLSEVQRDLIGHTSELLKELDEARWHAQTLASDLEAIAIHGPDFLPGAQETLALLRDALHLAEGSGCSLGALLTGTDSTDPPTRHAARLARVWMATSPDRAALERVELRHAAEAFASASP